jgi:mannose-1-phosphate guanylyltransferase
MIMAGGAGTRLWPMSRRRRPKQLLPLVQGRSLLELAARRLDGVVDIAHRYVCTGEAHRAAVREVLPDLDDEQILGEPTGRDTVNAVGLTAAVLHRADPEAIFAVLTADHVIEPGAEFRRALETGFALVERDSDRFITFAITPTHPATSYGYVKRGAPVAGADDAYEGAGFREKPSRATAESFLADGDWGWNSGMFVFHAGRFLDALARHLPDAHAGLARIAEAWDTPERAAVLEDVYPHLPATSVDYGVMEPAANDETIRVTCVTMKVTWLDIGSWPAFADTLDADTDGNRASTRTLLLDAHNVLAVSDDPDHLIAVVGSSDLIVVHTDDVTLVCPAEQAERVKELALRADESLR